MTRWVRAFVSPGVGGILLVLLLGCDDHRSEVVEGPCRDGDVAETGRAEYGQRVVVCRDGRWLKIDDDLQLRLGRLENAVELAELRAKAAEKDRLRAGKEECRSYNEDCSAQRRYFDTQAQFNVPPSWAVQDVTGPPKCEKRCETPREVWNAENERVLYCCPAARAGDPQ